MSSKSTKTNTKYRQTDRTKSLLTGVLFIILLVATPFLFYIYTFAPDSKEWDTLFGTVKASGFSSVQAYMHAVFTKLTFIMLTTIWFLTSNNWWKYAILVPFVMFLFQFIGVLNYELQYIDEFDFWYSLPIIIPILVFLIYISLRISKNKDGSNDLMSDVDDAIKKLKGEDL
ncbi:MAG: hypothetical protein ACKVGT_10625 [Flavobacteriales bacterium]|tara:strand:- start:428 stop:943 length:516 start_codon:yes stop_codon:yes gene_type:complete